MGGEVGREGGGEKWGGNTATRCCCCCCCCHDEVDSGGESVGDSERVRSDDDGGTTTAVIGRGRSPRLSFLADEEIVRAAVVAEVEVRSFLVDEEDRVRRVAAG